MLVENLKVIVIFSSISILYTLDVFASGGRDGQLLVWDSRAKNAQVTPMGSPFSIEEQDNGSVLEG